MGKTDIERKLNTAVEHAVPDVKQEILQRCKKEKDTTIPLIFSKRRKHRKSPLMEIVAAAAVLLLALNLTMGYQKVQRSNSISAVVDLDVNPSIELRLNAENRVVEVYAINQDAQEVLSGMDLTGAKTNVAVNAVLGAMLKSGYLSENANSILVSVDADDSTKSQQLQEELVTDIDTMLQACSVEAAILSQSVTKDPGLIEWADTYGISQGKASLIQKIIENNPQYCIDDLVALTINELNLLLSSQLEMISTISSTGTASEKSYIGQENALTIVLSIKGLTTENIAELNTAIEVLNARMVYGISFKYDNYLYQYKVDALTGEVVVSEVNDPNNAPVTTEPATISENTNPSNSGNTLSENTVSSPAISENTVSGNTVSGNTVSGNTVSANSIGITEMEARSIAITDAEIRDSDIVKSAITLITQDSVKFFTVELYTTTNCYYYEIDQNAGTILNSEKLQLDVNGNAIISEAQAEKIALDHARLSVDVVTFDKVELIEQDNGYVYLLTFQTRTNMYQYTIDAIAKTVLDYSKSSLGSTNTQTTTQQGG